MKNKYEEFYRRYVKGFKVSSNGQAEGLCPFHDDKRASLSVNLNTGQWKCHASCGSGNSLTFCDKLGIPREQSPDYRKSNKNSKRIVAEYPYKDEDGKLLFVVVRFKPKDFRVKRPNGQGGWIWNLGGVKRVPYKLPELLKGPDPIIILEGEKDVDRLRREGFTATCNQGGAGKWRPEFSHYFKDRKVIIIPDNDEPGRKHAKDVASNLFPVAKWVKIVPLSEDFEDVSNYLNNGKTAEDLKKLIQKTSILTAEQVEETSDTKIDLEKWLAGEIEYKREAIFEYMLGLDPVGYESARTAVAEKLSWRVSKLDQWYEERNASGAPAEMIAPTSPWPEVVRLQEIAEEISTILRRYVVMSEECLAAVTLWTCISWLYDRFDVFPYLLLSSPVKRCGKTRLLGILRYLVNKGLQAANISPAALFRVVEAERPTLLLDEFDQQLNVEDLPSFLNSGHERSGAAIRLVPLGKDFVPKRFSTFCPKVIAMIGKPKDTLVDRSIVVAMQRKKPEETLDRLTPDVVEKFQVLQRKLARWKVDVGELPDVEQLNTTNDREADNWLPLLTVAEMAGAEWPQRAQEAAKALSKDVEDDSIKIQLLRDVRHIFQEEGTDKITTSELLEKLRALEESPWSDWGYGKGLNARHLANLLKPFGIEPKVIRIGDKTPRGYELQDFIEIFEVYIPSNPPELSATSATSLNLLNLQPQQNATKAKNVADISSNKNNNVADKIGGVGEHISQKPSEPCFCCKERDWWYDKVGKVWKCNVCHPQPR